MTSYLELSDLVYLFIWWFTHCGYLHFPKCMAYFMGGFELLVLNGGWKNPVGRCRPYEIYEVSWLADL